jgi:hypothetical protein
VDKDWRQERMKQEERGGAAGDKKRKSARIRESREEGQLGFSKGVYAISENCKDLIVKQNFPSI